MATLRPARSAVGGRRVSPWQDYSLLALARTLIPRAAHSVPTAACTSTRRLHTAAAAVSHIVSQYKTLRQDDFTSAFAAKTECSQRGLGRLDPTRSAARLRASLFAAPDHNSSWSGRTINVIAWYFRIARPLFDSPRFTSENAIGSKSETEISNRIPAINTRPL